MKKDRILALLLTLCFLLTACGGSTAQDEDTGKDDTVVSGSDKDSTGSGTVSSDSEMFTDRDLRTTYDESKAAVITLSGSSASCSSDAVKIDGGAVTITDEGTYIITGELSDGQIVVNAGESDKPQLVLRDASVHSDSSAALYILEADKVVVTLEGSSSLVSGDSFEAIDENNIDGTVYSKQDLTFNGSGSLTVTSPAGHGIVGKDDVVFAGGSYTITSASHGVDANDSVRCVGADLVVDAGKDAIHAENSDDASLGFVYIESGTFTLEGEGDGISAGAAMDILGGSFAITAGGGSENAATQISDSWGGFMGGGKGGMGMGGGKGGMGSAQSSSSSSSGEDSTSMKGLKSAGDMIISGGIFVINSADDAVHSNASVTVNGGSFDITTGDDGFHADETLIITGGAINVKESYEGLEGLDIRISGGDIDLVTSDDGINAAGGTDSSGTGGLRGGDQFGPGGMGGMSSGNGSIAISGGDIYINASGDGIDANGTLEISGGYVVVCGPTQGDTAVLDYDKTAVITGGTFIGTGAITMAQTFSEGSTQGVFAVNVGTQSAGSLITLTDAKGNEVLRYSPDLSYNLVILSCPDMVKGEEYTITVGEASGTFEAS